MKRLWIGLGIGVLIAAAAIVISRANEHAPATQDAKRHAKDPESLLLEVEGNVNRRVEADDVRRALRAASIDINVRSIVMSGDRRRGFDVQLRFEPTKTLARAARRMHIRAVMRSVYESIYTAEFAGLVRNTRVDALTPPTEPPEAQRRLFSTSLDATVGQQLDWSQAGLDLSASWTELFRSADF
jgi:hypothetical protein